MERSYLLTPEMLGLSWSRLFRRAIVRSAIYLLAAIFFSGISNGHWTSSIGAALIGAAVDFGLTFTVRFYVPTCLRITDEQIEEVDGPIIRKNDIFAVYEDTDGELRGLEVLGRRRLSWLPKYRIFIPATVADFNELRVTLRGWSEGHS